MSRDLGGFTTVADRRNARAAALTSSTLVFAVAGAIALRLGLYVAFLGAIAFAFLVFFGHRRVAAARAAKGVIDLEDDARLGVVLVFRRRGHALHRVPLARATIVGRTRTLASVGAIRVQIEVSWDDQRFVATLAVPFRAAPGDVDGVLPSALDLDRIGSRALDALSYEVASARAKNTNE